MANLESLQAWKTKNPYRWFMLEMRRDAVCNVVLYGEHGEEAFSYAPDFNTAIGIALASAAICGAPITATCLSCGRRYTLETAAKRQLPCEIPDCKEDFILFRCECGRMMTISLPVPERTAGR